MRGECDGGEERRTQQRGAHLLEHDREFGHGGTRPAELFRDGDAVQPQFAGHLMPHRFVVSLRGGHQVADPVGRGGDRQKLPHRLPEFVGFTHRGFLWCGSARPDPA